MKFVSLALALLGGTAISGVLGYGQALAQDAPSASAPGGAVEEITVVGTQIQGAKVTGALPVTVVGVDRLAATGAFSASDLFRTLPQAGDVNFNEQTLGGGSPNAARGDISTVTLRGLGQGNTLLLLNGRRMVLHPTSQSDLTITPQFGYNANAIPTGGLERVEVLRDGAAALYGSDAVAGVVNNVLRSNIRGLQIDTQYGGADSTSLREFQFNALGGTRFAEGRGSISLFLGYTTKSALKVSDQDYTSTANRASLVAGTPFAGVAAFDSRSSSSPWAAFQAPAANGALRSNGAAVTNASGVFHVQPTTVAGCGAGAGPGICLASGAITAANLQNLRLDSARTFPDMTVQPSLQRYNMFSFINYDLTPNLRFFSELGFYGASTKAYVGATSPLSTAPITLSPTAYWNPFGATGTTNRLPGLTGVPASGLPLTLLNYSVVDAGMRKVSVVNQQYRLLAGLKGEKWGWRWESAALYNAATVKDTSDYISSTLFQQSLNGTTPSAYNPFNGGNTSQPSLGDPTASNIAGFRIQGTRFNETTLASWDFKVSNAALFQLPGGAVGLAAGVEVRRETYKDDRDTRQDGSTPYVDAVTGIRYSSDLMGTSPSPDVRGDRTVESAYAEAAIPVVGPAMRIPFMRAVDLQVAGRFENYSDVGSVTKPKIAGSWDVVDGLRLRSSWSQGFRAPNLEVLNTTVLERSNGRVDYYQCEQDLRARRIASFSACNRSYSNARLYAGNPNLKPENSTSFSYGVVLQPKFMPPQWGALTLTADRWKIDQTGVVGLLDDQNAVTLDYLLRLQGSSNPNIVRAAPTADDVAAAAGTGLAPVGQIIQARAQFQNLAPRTVEGWDFGITYRLRNTPVGSFTVDLGATQLIRFYQSPSSDEQKLLEAKAAGRINGAVAVNGAANLIRAGGNPQWKWSGTATWDYGPVQLGLFGQHIGDVLDPSVVDPVGNVWTVKQTFTVNVYGQYHFDKAGWASDTTVRVGVRNVGDVQPPLTASGYLGSLYQPYGRYLYLSLHKAF